MITATGQTQQPNSMAEVVGGFLFLLMIVVLLSLLAWYMIRGAKSRRDAARLQAWYDSQPSGTGQAMVGGIRCEWFGTCWNMARLWRINDQGQRVPICGACNERANRTARR